MNKKIFPVILCGGSGTRLWPLSRKSLPKQFIDLPSNETLFGLTLSRAKKLNSIDKPIIISSKNYGFLCKKIAKKQGVDCSFILEEIGRNTAPAIFFSAMLSLESDQNPILCIMPSDHWIDDDNLFIKMIEKASKSDFLENWVTFGIEPYEPATGFGYIKTHKINREEFEVISFEEKPNLDKANSYYANKNYFWNSGIFFVSAKKCIQSFKLFQPDLYRFCMVAWNNRIKKKNEEILIESDLQNINSISIDYAILEKEKNIKLIPFKSKWSDVGNWDSFSKILNNTTNNNSKNILLESENSFIYSSKRTIVGIGLEDLLIVDNDDATLIAKKGDSEKVKEAIAILKNNKIRSSDEHTFEFRPWGKYEILLQTEYCKVKKLTVDPGQHLSYQFHNRRSEHWVVVAGKALVMLNDKKIILSPGSSIDIPKGSSHSLGNENSKSLVVIEIQLGDYFGEDDIVRIDDPYDR